jgi:hypothetical protein
MTSFKEDEELLQLIRNIIRINDKLESNGDSKLKLVLPVDERKNLEKQFENISEQLDMIRIELDRIRIRETPHVKYLADFLRKWTYRSVKDEEFHDFWDYHGEYILEYHEDNELLDRGTFIRNYFKLIPPYVKVGTKIPEGIQNIYQESRWCFVYGQYCATVALSRSVIETVLKREFHLEGILKEAIKTAKDRGLINGGTAWNANKIRLFANNTLHEAKPVTEDQAMDAITYTLRFLEEIYF